MRVDNPTITKVANLTTNGFVKTGSSDGTLSVDTNSYGFSGPIKLGAATTYYVRTDGNDSNDGSANDAAHAWLTLQNAVNYIQNNLYLNGYNVTVQVGDGTYTGAVNITGDPPGAGAITINGNSGDHNAVILTFTSGTGTVIMQNVKKWNFQSLQIASSSTCAYGIYASNYTVVGLNGVNFGACVTGHMFANQHSAISIGGAYVIAGNAPYHMIARLQSTIISGVAITVTGRTFSSVFISSYHASTVSLENATWTGTFTGQRYEIARLGLLDTAGQATTWIPGSVGGTTATGGIYA